MGNRRIITSFLFVSLVTRALAGYDCICNYEVVKEVYRVPDSTSQPLGYMYEFECKPEFQDKGNVYFGIQFENQIGYITRSQLVRKQVCPGLLPDGDRIQTTTKRSVFTSRTTELLSMTHFPTKTRTTSETITTTSSSFSISSVALTSSITNATARPTTTTTTIESTTTRPKEMTTAPEATIAAKTPVTWPIGTYGLMQTRQGCPGGNTRWLTGWRKQDTEDSDSHNYFTAGVQNFLDGEFASKTMVTRFCIKDTVKTSKYDKNWPSGSYCILKHKSCPAGFRSGYIFWDDEDSTNSNSHGGALPDGVYDSNTKIYYCCRGDGRANSEIILPTERPFILLRYGTVCQSVSSMSARDVYVRWDDEDTLNSSGRGGAHPFDDGGSKDHILHFCYYHSQTGPSFVG